MLGSDLGGMTRWDFRGHGRSGGGERPLSWWDMASDLAAVRDSVETADAIGVGHSMGGATLLMAQLLDPSRFAGLVLVEPILPQPPYGRFELPLVEAARKRKRSFPDLLAVRENFEDKAPFDHWVDAAFDGYLEDGFLESDGQIVVACAPEFEAEVYLAAGAHGMFGRLREVEVPVVLLFGDSMDTFTPEWIEAISSSLPNGTVQIVDDADHFIPMARPEVVADAVLAVS